MTSGAVDRNEAKEFGGGVYAGRGENILSGGTISGNKGGKDGGGSRLTPEGKELLAKYEAYRDQCAEANRRIYHQIFSAEQ